MDTAAIDAVMQRFPCWFYEQLRDRRFILADETVTVVVKRKSRAVGEGDFKISYHFIVEIAGTPVWHSAVCNEIFMPLAADIKEIQSSKSVAHLSDAQIRVPAFYCDIATFHGHQGFATYFSLKNPNDPPSTLICRLAFRRGAEVARKDFIPGPHDPAGDLALGFLTHASYTLAKAYVGNYADSVGVLVRLVLSFYYYFHGDRVESNHCLTPLSRRSQNMCRGALQPRRRALRTPPFAPAAVEVAATPPRTCQAGLRGCSRGTGGSLGVCGTMRIRA